MKKFFYLLINILPIVVGYGVFAILLIIFGRIPSVGQSILKLWYIPFTILTTYMCYIILKDFRSTKPTN
ncbi:MAG: hypothetical protein ACFWUA_05160 [Sporanaerobacter sp.]|jgi:hypothetical protein